MGEVVISIKRNSRKTGVLLLIVFVFASNIFAQTPKRIVRIFLDVRETNMDKPSTVALNTLSERLAAGGFRVTTNRREAAVVLEGTIASRSTPVTDEVKREGGVNAEASASTRLLVGDEVIATSVERTSPGDWGVQPERVGEDRLIEVAGLIADDLISGDALREITGGDIKPGSTGVTASRPAGTAKKTPKKARRGVSYLEVVSLVQNSAPEERIVTALRKHGIKFKPRDAALGQLRTLGASESLITAVKNCIVVS